MYLYQKNEQYHFIGILPEYHKQGIVENKEDLRGLEREN